MRHPLWGPSVSRQNGDGQPEHGADMGGRGRRALVSVQLALGFQSRLWEVAPHKVLKP
jgi:hypothetical protein